MGQIVNNYFIYFCFHLKSKLFYCFPKSPEGFVFLITFTKAGRLCNLCKYKSNNIKIQKCENPMLLNQRLNALANLAWLYVVVRGRNYPRKF